MRPVQNSTFSRPRATSPIASATVLPCSDGDDAGELLGAGADDLAQAEHHRASLGEPGLAPRGLGGLGGLGRLVHEVRGSERDLGGLPPGRGVVDGAPAALGSEPLAADDVRDRGERLRRGLFGLLDRGRAHDGSWGRRVRVVRERCRGSDRTPEGAVRGGEQGDEGAVLAAEAALGELFELRERELRGRQVRRRWSPRRDGQTAVLAGEVDREGRVEVLVRGGRRDDAWHRPPDALRPRAARRGVGDLPEHLLVQAQLLGELRPLGGRHDADEQHHVVDELRGDARRSPHRTR